MLSQMSAFFSDLRSSIKSSMKGNGKNGGNQFRKSSKYRSGRRGRGPPGLEGVEDDEEDVVRPRGCLGRSMGRSISMEWGLSSGRKRRTSGASSEFISQPSQRADMRAAASMADIPSQRNRSGSSGDGWQGRTYLTSNGQLLYEDARDDRDMLDGGRVSTGYDNLPVYENGSARRTSDVVVLEDRAGTNVNRVPSYVDRAQANTNDLYTGFDRGVPRLNGLNGYGGSQATDLNRSGGNDLVGVADVSSYSIEMMCDPVLVRNTARVSGRSNKSNDGKENMGPPPSVRSSHFVNGGGEFQAPRPAPRHSRSSSGAQIVQQDSIRSATGSIASQPRTESYKSSSVSLQASGGKISNRRRRNSPQIISNADISTPLTVKIPSSVPVENGSLGRSSNIDGGKARPRARVIPAPTYETSPVWSATSHPLDNVGVRTSMTTAVTVPHSLHLNGNVEPDMVDSARLDNYNYQRKSSNQISSRLSVDYETSTVRSVDTNANNAKNSFYDNLNNLIQRQGGLGMGPNLTNITEHSTYTTATGASLANPGRGMSPVGSGVPAPSLAGMGSVVGGSTLSLYNKGPAEPQKVFTGSQRALNERRGSGGKGQPGNAGVSGGAGERMQYVTDAITRTNYVRGKLLGKGGFAKCYELTDLLTGMTYAGKIISRARLTRPSQKDKILREVELHRHLDHRNVVKFRSYFEDDQSVYIVLEYCSRKSLVHILKIRRSLTEPEVRYYLHHLFKGVQYIHSQRIIHRDLKLGNMLLNESMDIKIADFGLATRVEYEGEKKMTVCGTPNYIAPEVLQKRGHSYEADIWAMGCVMYALLCGRPPFETATLKETYMRIVTNKYIIPPQVSLSAKLFIQRLLTSNPRDRPSLAEITVDEFFTSGYLPPTLSPTTCDVPPKFPVAQLLQQRPKTSAVPPSSSKSNHVTNGSTNQTSSLAQSKNSRKSASQIITRNKTPDFESVGSLKDSDYQLGGSAPSIQRELSEDLASLPYRSAVRLHTLLTLCVQTPSQQNSSIAQVQRTRTICVTKWVDYSNKYGFGFQLSNGCVGILFNDQTRMLLTSDSKTVLFSNPQNKFDTFSAVTPPSEHQKKVTLLLYFAQYMETHLIPGSQSVATDRATSIFMKTFFRTDTAIVMYLTDGTLQVNFLEDHTKVILNPDGPDFLLTVVDHSRQSNCYSLSALKHFGCTPDMLERLRYTCHMLDRIRAKDAAECSVSTNGTSVNNGY